MDHIYDEMYQRNTKWLETNDPIYDPCLLPDKIDTRRCIAIVCDGNMTVSPELNVEMNRLTQSLLSECEFIIPKLHHTFLVAREWTTHDYPTMDWTELKSFFTDNLPSYSISFQRLIPVKTGILLAGYPTIDVNSIRDKLRATGLVSGELYNNNIIHMTLFRWTNKFSDVQKRKLLDWCSSCQQKEYASLTVEKLHITNASWCMREGEYQIQDTIKLKI